MIKFGKLGIFDVVPNISSQQRRIVTVSRTYIELL